MRLYLTSLRLAVAAPELVGDKQRPRSQESHDMRSKRRKDAPAQIFVGHPQGVASAPNASENSAAECDDFLLEEARHTPLAPQADISTLIAADWNATPSVQGGPRLHRDAAVALA